MNKKINKYFLVLSLLSIVLMVCNFLTLDKRNVDNMYIYKVDDLFEDLYTIEELFDIELDNYFTTNIFSKYSLKEIRDGYTNIKSDITSMINQIEDGGYSDQLNNKYLSYILKDILSVIDNKFLREDIFSSGNDMVIKNIQNIIDELKVVKEKYNLLKFNFGLVNI